MEAGGRGLCRQGALEERRRGAVLVAGGGHLAQAGEPGGLGGGLLQQLPVELRRRLEVARLSLLVGQPKEGGRVAGSQLEGPFERHQRLVAATAPLAQESQVVVPAMVVGGQFGGPPVAGFGGLAEVVGVVELTHQTERRGQRGGRRRRVGQQAVELLAGLAQLVLHVGLHLGQDRPRDLFGVGASGEERGQRQGEEGVPASHGSAGSWGSVRQRPVGGSAQRVRRPSGQRASGRAAGSSASPMSTLGSWAEA